jgi:hypothetical protein
MPALLNDGHVSGQGTMNDSGANDLARRHFAISDCGSRISDLKAKQLVVGSQNPVENL